MKTVKSNKAPQTTVAKKEVLFSAELESWLKDKDQKTLNDLENVFAERSFAIIILLLMALPALPIPTGGISHIFEIIALTVSAQMIIGKEKLWLPQKWRRKEISDKVQKAMIVPILKFVRFFEKFSKPRFGALIGSRFYTSISGIIISVFTIFAMGAVPFSGLDTLPAMGVVVICLSIILKDIILTPIGLILGTVGVALIISAGFAITKIFSHFF